MNHTLSPLPPEQIEVIIEQEKDITKKFVLLQQLADETAEEAEKLAGIPEAEEKFEYAKQKYIQALQIARKMRDEKLVCTTLTDLGSIFENLQDTNLAIDYYEQAVKVAQKMEDFIALSDIYGRLGILHLRIGNVDLANQYFDLSTEAAEIAELSPINAEEEQTASTPTSKIPSRSSRLPPPVQKSIEVSNEINQLKGLRTAQQRIAIIVDILLVIVLIIFRNIFSNGAFSSIPFIIFSLFIIVAGGTLTYLAFIPTFRGKLRTRQTRRMRKR
jgi:tetratricopeptide (TPR) repeat protein